MNKGNRKQQKNFRFSEKTLQILDEVEQRSGWSQTKIIETAVAKQAVDMPNMTQALRERARELLIELLIEFREENQTERRAA